MRLALAVLLLFLVPARAEARMMFHHDLASLAFLSEAVVRAERLTPHGDAATRFRVTEVFAGPLSVGDVVTLDTGIFRLGFMTPAITVSSESVLFLMRNPAGWALAPSGLRVVHASTGRVHRFVQVSNPGPYVAVPQGLDPFDVRTSIESRSVDIAGFLPMVRRGVQRAAQMRSALALTVASERRARVLALLGPPPASTIEAPLGFFYLDALADRAAHALAEHGDAEGALEVWARMVGYRAWARSLRGNASVRTQAFDRTVPVHRRVAALEVSFMPGQLPTDTQAASLVALLEDPSARVRAAALAALDVSGRTQSTSAVWPDRQRRLRATLSVALASRWPRETSPVVRVRMLRSTAVWNITPRGTGRWAFAAERVGDEVRFIWARRGEGPGPNVRIEGCALDDRLTSGWNASRHGGGRLTPVSCALPWTVVVRHTDGRELSRATVR